jgi:hypothetical protein
MEISAIDKKQAIHDIRANGYTITSNTLLPSNHYDYVMRNTNANKWDWQDMSKIVDKLLKRK